MKIAIMTFYRDDNYGTVLQAAALRQYLLSCGHSADIIRYRSARKVSTVPRSTMRAEFRERVKEELKEAANPLIIEKNSGEAFDRFRKSYFTMSPKCVTLSDLEQLNELYDAFICGSERVWLAPSFDSHLFLDFVHDPERMIAYAPCILREGMEDLYIRKRIGELIGRFRHLSVREGNGRKLLDEYYQIQTEEVADPVLLLTTEEWREAFEDGRTDEETQEPYAFIYFLSDRRSYWDAAYKLADRLGLSVKTVPSYEKDLKLQGVLTDEVDPCRFAELISKADYVCTDCYHAMLLAILFHREMCCFNRYLPGTLSGRNARVKQILDAVGLSRRLYEDNAPLEQYLEKTDFIPVQYKLDALRLKSRSFLSAALEEVEKHVVKTQTRIMHVREGYRLCCGCGACEALCPAGAVSVAVRENGFIEAEVDEEKCIRCGKCTEVCPMRGEAGGTPLEEGSLLSYTDEDPQICSDSDAGGLAARLSAIMLGRGYSVAGCTYDEERMQIRHIVVDPDSMPDEDDVSEDPLSAEETVSQTEEDSPEDVGMTEQAEVKTSEEFIQKGSGATMLQTGKETAADSETSEEAETETAVGADTSKEAETETAEGADTSKEAETETAEGADTSEETETETAEGAETSEEAETAIAEGVDTSEEAEAEAAEDSEMAAQAGELISDDAQTAVLQAEEEIAKDTKDPDLRTEEASEDREETGEAVQEEETSEDTKTSLPEEDEVFEDPETAARRAEEKRQEYLRLQLKRLRGAKPFQSDFSQVWELLKTEKPAVIIGTPCQIRAARKLSGDREDMLFIDFVCRGMPSTLLLKKYRKIFRGRNDSENSWFRIRTGYKIPGKGNAFIQVTDGQHERIISAKKDSLSRLLGTGSCCSECCFNCRWRDRSCADLRIGRADGSGYPAKEKRWFRFFSRKNEVPALSAGCFGNRREDITAVFCITQKGKDVLDLLMTEGYWEGLHKQRKEDYIRELRTVNPPIPVYYPELFDALRSDSSSMRRLVNEFVRPVEKYEEESGRLKRLTFAGGKQAGKLRKQRKKEEGVKE